MVKQILGPRPDKVFAHVGQSGTEEYAHAGTKVVGASIAKSNQHKGPAWPFTCVTKSSKKSASMK